MIEVDGNSSSGCLYTSLPGMKILNYDLICEELEHPDDKATWQQNVKIYAQWMMNNTVSHSEITEWLKKFLTNVYPSQYFIIFSMDLNENGSNLQLSDSCNENLTSECFLTVSGTSTTINRSITDLYR